jgi:hypothetical protein
VVIVETAIVLAQTRKKAQRRGRLLQKTSAARKAVLTWRLGKQFADASSAWTSRTRARVHASAGAERSALRSTVVGNAAKIALLATLSASVAQSQRSSVLRSRSRRSARVKTRG